MSEIATDIINKVFAGDAPAEVTDLIKGALYAKSDELLQQARTNVFDSVMNSSEESDEGEEEYEDVEDESSESEEEE